MFLLSLCFFFSTLFAQNVKTYSLDVHPVSTIKTMPDRFGSVTIDMGELLGNFWNSTAKFPFKDPKVIAFAKALAPGYLRVGGTAADGTFYNVSGTVQKLPPGYNYSLQANEVMDLLDFAKATGLALVFGINAGPGPRNNSNGAWEASNAMELVNFAEKHAPGGVYAYELGNEPNLFLINWGIYISGATLAKDFDTFRSALNSAGLKNVKLGGVDAAFQIPVLGSGLPTTKQFLKHNGTVDFLTYHYYPLISPSGIPAPARNLNPWNASIANALKPTKTWDQTRLEQEKMVALAKNHTIPEVWLGETALASFGGVSGVTDVLASSLWYLDTLSFGATGLDAVARQTLMGSNYGLLRKGVDQPIPTPDYWVLWMFKQIMGPKVLHLTITGADTSRNLVSAYAHCSNDASGDVRLVVINLGDEPAKFAWFSRGVAPNATAIVITGEDQTNPAASRTILANGNKVEATNGVLPAVDSLWKSAEWPLELEKHSFMFVKAAGADVAACK